LLLLGSNAVRLSSIRALARVRHVIGRRHKVVTPTAQAGLTLALTPITEAGDSLGDIDPRIAQIINEIPRRRRRHI
jgi:F420-0:gamma-glutamyl ligase-like protein